VTAAELIAECRKLNATFEHARIEQIDRKGGGITLESRCLIHGKPYELITLVEEHQRFMLDEAEMVQLTECRSQLLARS
jgi:hypothetical protein